MRYYDYSQGDMNKNEKIPYDSEPIRRSNQTRKAVSGKTGGSSKVVTFLLVVLICFNIVLGFLVFKLNLNNQNTRTPVEVNYTINGDYANTTYIASKAMPSAVCIASGYNSYVPSASSLNYTNFQNMSDKGSGVITAIDKQAGSATIVTCEHVVSGNQDSIFILLSDSYKPIKASYIGGIKEKDIAVLKIVDSDEIRSSSAMACTVADSMYIAQGNQVLAVGNPMATGFDTTAGIIRKTQTLLMVNNTGLERVIATDVPINSGNSGGGLFNSKGELIGIVNAKVEDVSIDNYTYAIPSNLAISIANSIEKNEGEALKASLGLKFYTSEIGRETQIIEGNTIYKDTVVVQELVSGSDAAKAGIQNNDIVLSFTYHDSVTVDMLTAYSFEDHAYNIGVGDKVVFKLLRGSSSSPIYIEVVINHVV